jgi:hypothetical protein
MDLSAPPLVPLAALALASSGSVGGPAGPDAAVPVGVHAGATTQRLPLSIRVREDGRAAWRIRYVARCEDGTVVRGRYFSGRGTPLLDLAPHGRFRLSRSEPAEFRPGGTGSARFTISGRLGERGGSGRWRLRLLSPPGANGRVACTVGPLRWRASRG